MPNQVPSLFVSVCLNFKFLNFSWDYIVKLENARDEFAYAYRQINGRDIPILLPMPRDKYGDEKKIRQLRSVPFDLLHQVLSKIYVNDYKVFGYDIPVKPF